MIQLICGCGKRLLADETFAGQRVDCSFCNRSLEVPASVFEPVNDQFSSGAGPQNARNDAARLSRGFSLAAATLGVVSVTFYGTGWSFGASCAAIFGTLVAMLGLSKLRRSPFEGEIAPLIGFLFCASIAILALTKPVVVELAQTPGAEFTKGSKNLPNGESPRTRLVELAQAAKTDWIPASMPARQGDFQIQILSAAITQPQVRDIFSDEVSPWRKPVLTVRLEVENMSKTNVVPYRMVVPKVTDDRGNPYREINLGTASLVERFLGDRKLYPGKSLRDIFLFETPPPEVQYLELEFPGESVAATVPFRFRIPAQMVER